MNKNFERGADVVGKVAAEALNKVGNETKGIAEQFAEDSKETHKMIHGVINVVNDIAFGFSTNGDARNTMPTKAKELLISALRHIKEASESLSDDASAYYSHFYSILDVEPLSPSQFDPNKLGLIGQKDAEYLLYILVEYKAFLTDETALSVADDVISNIAVSQKKREMFELSVQETVQDITLKGILNKYGNKATEQENTRLKDELEAEKQKKEAYAKNLDEMKRKEAKRIAAENENRGIVRFNSFAGEYEGKYYFSRDGSIYSAGDNAMGINLIMQGCCDRVQIHNSRLYALEMHAHKHEVRRVFLYDMGKSDEKVFLEHTTLYDLGVGSFVVSGDDVYYAVDSSSSVGSKLICKSMATGKQKTLYKTREYEKFDDLTVVGNDLIFIAGDKIHKLSKQGGKAQVLADEYEPCGIFVTNDTIYFYIHVKDGTILMGVDLNGQAVRKIKTVSRHIKGNIWIHNGYLYSIRTNVDKTAEPATYENLLYREPLADSTGESALNVGNYQEAELCIVEGALFVRFRNTSWNSYTAVSWYSIEGENIRKIW